MISDSEQQYKDIRSFFKQWPSLYYFVMVVFGPALLLGESPKSFLRKYPSKGTIVNLGSGPRMIAPHIINVDSSPYKGVSVVADITELPFDEESVSRIICDNVLEHVKDTPKAVQEIFRVLEPGGVAYISTPFLYPFHSSPDDYVRWTTHGLKYLFRDFEVVRIGTRSGIFSSFTVLLCYLIATLFSFGSKKFYWLLVNVSIFIFFPIKFLDVFTIFLPNTSESASVLYCIIRKK